MNIRLLSLVLCFFIGSSSIFSQNTYVPDDTFEQELINLGLDSILDDFVLTANINTVTTLDLSNKAIVNLQGIEDFLLLEELDCNNNGLTSLDVSNNIQLDK